MNKIVKKFKFIVRNIDRIIRQQYYLSYCKTLLDKNCNTHPPSSFQERYYYLENIGKKDSSNTVKLLLSYSGEANVDLIKQAIKIIVENNEILRTTFIESNGILTQVIHDHFEPAVITHDLTSTVSLIDYDQYVNKIASKTFELDKLPLFEIHILKLDAYKIEILTNFHHLIWDGWSQYLFYRELSTIYNTLSELKEFDYKPRPQYKLYASIEDRYCKANLEQAVVFYKKYLKNHEVVNLNLQADNTSDTTESDVILIPIKSEIIDRAKSTCTKINCTLNEFLLSAFFITLYYFCKQENISVMIPRFNRFHPTFQKMYGPMLNALPILTRIEPDLKVTEFVSIISRTIKQLFAYDDTPIDKIISEIKKDPEYTGKTFDFQFLFNYISPEWANHVQLTGLNLHKERLIIPELNHLMTMYISGDSNNGDMGITFAYQKAKLTRNVAELLLNSYLQIVENISANYSSQIKTIKLTSDISDNTKLSLSLPITRTPFSPIVNKAISSIIENKDRNFLIQGEHIYTYQALLNSIIQICELISHHIHKPNQVIIIAGKRDLYFYAAMLATMAHNQTIFLLDENKNISEIEILIKQLAPNLIISNDSLHYVLFKEKFCKIIDVRDLPEQSNHDHSFLINKTSEIQPNDTAYIVSTSGSTGTPKLIKGSQEGLAHFINWQHRRFKITNSDCCAQITGVGFDVVYREILTPIISGSTLSLPSGNLWTNHIDFANWFKKDKVTFIHVVPSVLDVIIKSFNTCNQVILPDLKYLFTAGEPLSDHLITAWKHATYSNVIFVNLYGPSETTLAKSYYIAPSIINKGIQPIGSPIDQTQIYISRHDLSPCIPFEHGQIIIRTPYRSQGYHGHEKSHFIINPFTNIQDDLLYQTGDYGHIDTDGLIHIHGRADDQIKVNGVKFHLSAVEYQLIQIPYISDCVVIQKEFQPGEKILTAYISTTHNDSKLSKRNIISRLSERIPDYMIPTKFYYIDSIPKTHSGKKDRQRLLNGLLESREITDDIVIPTSETEKIVCNIWTRITGNKSISVLDTQKQAGIDSLTSVKCLFEINKTFNTNITPIEFMRNDTIRKISALIDSNEADSQSYSIDKLKIKDLKKYLKNINKPNVPVGDSNINILLTGVTGFLGSYIFKELVESYPEKRLFLLIRSTSNSTSTERVRSICKDMQIDYQIHQDRIKVIDADLSKPQLGLNDNQYDILAKSIDTIIHCGALVNFASPITDLKAANIDGTYEIIKLSMHDHLKPISYISTAGIIPSTDTISRTTITESISIDFGDEVEIYGGYAQTKWVAEYAMHEAKNNGVPVKIYRVGRISGDSTTGMWPQTDFIYSFIRTVDELRMAPDINVKIDLLPVDITARMIATIHEDSWDDNYCFHLVNPNKLSMSELAEILSKQHDRVSISSYQSWRNTVFAHIKEGKDIPLSPFIHLLPMNIDDLPRLKYERHIDVKYTRNRLQSYRLDFPIIDKQTITRYLGKNLGGSFPF